MAPTHVGKVLVDTNDLVNAGGGTSGVNKC